MLGLCIGKETSTPYSTADVVEEDNSNDAVVKRRMFRSDEDDDINSIVVSIVWTQHVKLGV